MRLVPPALLTLSLLAGCCCARSRCCDPSPIAVWSVTVGTNMAHAHPAIESDSPQSSAPRVMDVGPIELQNSTATPKAYTITFSVLDADGRAIRTVTQTYTVAASAKIAITAAEWGGAGIGDYHFGSVGPVTPPAASEK